MPNIASWLSSGRSYIDEDQRAASAWINIQDDPTTITLRRNNVALDPQMVRVTLPVGGSEQSGENVLLGRIGQESATVYGVRNHPDSAIADTDIQRGDRFVYGGKAYSVKHIALFPGEVVATAEVQS